MIKAILRLYNDECGLLFGFRDDFEFQDTSALNFYTWGDKTQSVRPAEIDDGTIQEYSELKSLHQRMVRESTIPSNQRSNYRYLVRSAWLPEAKNNAHGGALDNGLWISLRTRFQTASYRTKDGTAQHEAQIIQRFAIRDRSNSGRCRNNCTGGTALVYDHENYHRRIRVQQHVIVAIPKSSGITQASDFKIKVKTIAEVTGGSLARGTSQNYRLKGEVGILWEFGTFTPPTTPRPTEPTDDCEADVSITGVTGDGSSTNPFDLGTLSYTRLLNNESVQTNLRITGFSSLADQDNIFIKADRGNAPIKLNGAGAPYRAEVAGAAEFAAGRLRITTTGLTQSAQRSFIIYAGYYSGSSRCYWYFKVTVRYDKPEPEPCPTGQVRQADGSCACPGRRVWDAATQMCVCPTPPTNREFVPNTTTCATRVRCVTPFIRNEETDTCECPAIPDGFERTPGSTRCGTRRICTFGWKEDKYNEANVVHDFHVAAGAQAIDGPLAINCHDEKILQYRLGNVSPANGVRITTDDTFGVTRSPTYKMRTNLGFGETITGTLIASDGTNEISLKFRLLAAGVTCGPGQVCAEFSSSQSGVCIACGCGPLPDGHEWVQLPNGLPSCRSRPIPTRLRWKSGQTPGSTILVNVASDQTSFTLPEAVAEDIYTITYRGRFNNHPYRRNGRVLSWDASLNDGTTRTIQWYASAGGSTISLNIRLASPSRLEWRGCHKDGGRQAVRMSNAHSMQLRVPLATGANGPISYLAQLQQSRNVTVRFVNQVNNPHILIEPTKNFVRRSSGDPVYAFDNIEQRNFTVALKATDGYRTITLYYDITNDMDKNLGYSNGYAGIAEGYNPGETFFFDEARSSNFALPKEGGRIALMAPVNDADGDTEGITLSMVSTAPASLWTGVSRIVGAATGVLQRPAVVTRYAFPPLAQASGKIADPSIFDPTLQNRDRLVRSAAGYELDVNGLPPGDYVFTYSATKGDQTLSHTLNLTIVDCDVTVPPPKPPPNVVDALTWADECYNNGQPLTYNISPAFTRITLPEATGGTDRITYEVVAHSGFDFTYLPYEHQMVISPVVGTQRYTLIAMSGDKFITAELTVNIISEYEDASPDPIQQCDPAGPNKTELVPNPAGKPSMYIATHFAGIMRDKNVVTRIPGAVVSGYNKLVPGRFYGVDENGELAAISIDPQTGQTPHAYFLRALSRYELVIMPTINGTVIIDTEQLGGRIS